MIKTLVKPLSSNTAGKRLNEMGEDIEANLVVGLRSWKFSVDMHESTVRTVSPMQDIHIKVILPKKFYFANH